MPAGFFVAVNFYAYKFVPAPGDTSGASGGILLTGPASDSNGTLANLVSFAVHAPNDILIANTADLDPLSFTLAWTPKAIPSLLLQFDSIAAGGAGTLTAGTAFSAINSPNLTASGSWDFSYSYVVEFPIHKPPGH